MLVTDRGRLIRLRVEDIRVVGRNTQGVKLIEIDDGERLVSLARVDESTVSLEDTDDTDDTGSVEATPDQGPEGSEGPEA